MEPATQEICDDGMDDMQPEAGAAPIATRREERIEGIALDIKAHAATVVGFRGPASTGLVLPPARLAQEWPASRES